MIREKCWKDAVVKRAVKEKERLSKLHLITSADELNKKTQKTFAIIREHRKLMFLSLLRENRDHYQISSKNSQHIYSLM